MFRKALIPALLFTTTGCAVQEPVTLAEMKTHARYEYKLDCLREMMRERNLPANFAVRHCNALVKQRYFAER